MDVTIVSEAGKQENIEIPDELIASAKLLPYAPTRYFESVESSETIALASLTQTRARLDGITHAIILMDKAYRGVGPRRNPISVRNSTEDRYMVVDGNSTVTVARAAGWRDVPCVFV